jgi:hypothetical protein
MLSEPTTATPVPMGLGVLDFAGAAGVLAGFSDLATSYLQHQKRV